MDHKFRITSTWDKGNKYFPVGAFFNVISNSDFIEVLGYLVDGIGVSIEEAGCFFSDSNDPWEEPFTGLKFSVMDESIVLSFQEAYQFMQLACKAYIEDHPQDKEKVEALEKQFYDKYCR